MSGRWDNRGERGIRRRNGPNGTDTLPGRILILEDDEGFRSTLRRVLERRGHEVVEARDGIDGIEQLDDSLDLILLDIQMPNLDGVSFLRNLRNSDTAFRDIPVIAVTGMDDPESRERVFRSGANDFIAKPFDPLDLELRTEAQLRTKRALFRHGEAEERTTFRRLSKGAKETPGTSAAMGGMASLHTLERLVTAAEFRDGRKPTHIHRVAEMCRMVALAIGLPSEEIDLIGPASSLHDIGMMGIPESVILKRGPLSLQERAIMERHTFIGAQILKGEETPLLRLGARISLTHHERWDGTGYPLGLSGTEIPAPGRVTAVADVFDALTALRPFREPKSNDEAFDHLRRARGKELDPVMVDAFLEGRSQVEEIKARWPDEPRPWSSAGILESRNPLIR